MTLADLKTAVDRANQRIMDNGEDPSDIEVIIPVRGMCFSRVPVRSVKLGFDWYQGCLMVNPKEPVARVEDTAKQ